MAATTIAYIAAAISVASAAYSILNRPEIEDTGSKTQKRGTQAPRKVIYGTAIVDTVNIYNNVWDADSDKLLNIFAVGVGEVEDIHHAYADGQQILKRDYTKDMGTFTPAIQPVENFTTNYPLFVGNNTDCDPTDPAKRNIAFGWNGGSDKYDFVAEFDTQGLDMQFRYGLDPENASNLAVLHGDGEWTQSHRGDKVAHIVMVVERSTDADTPIMNARYNMTAKVSGVHVHDPRVHTLTTEKAFHHKNLGVPEANRACGRNPALCLMDFITNDYYGMGIDYSYIDVNSFVATANWCDANEIYIAGAVDTGESYGDCLAQILSSFHGILVIEEGVIVCKYEDTTAAYATTFDENNTIGLSDIVGNSNDNYYNIVEVKYKSDQVKQKFEVFQIPEDVNAIDAGDTVSRIERDGFVKTKKIEMPMTVDDMIQEHIYDDATSTYIPKTYPSGVTGAVKLFANRAYAKAQAQRGVTIKVDLSKYPVKVYDVIKISNKELGWVDETFRITTINKSADDDEFNIGELVCTEYKDSFYTGTLDGSGSTGRPAPSKQLSAPLNLVFDLKHFNSDGYGELTWDVINKSNVDYQVEYRITNLVTPNTWERLGDTKNTNFKISNLKLADYDFRVRATKSGYIPSLWSELLQQTVSTSVILPTVTGMEADDSTIDTIFRWDDMTDVDIVNVIDPDDPDSTQTDGKVGTYFAYYEVEIKDGATQVDIFQSQVPEYIYTVEQNKANGVSRALTCNVKIVAKDGTKSATAGTVTSSNPQIGVPSITSNISHNGVCHVEWTASNEQDFAGTIVHAYYTSGQALVAGNKVAVLQGENTYTFVFDQGHPDFDPNDPKAYIRVGHFDTLGQDNMTFTPETLLSFDTINYEDLAPDVVTVIKQGSFSVTTDNQAFKFDDTGTLISASPINFSGNKTNINGTVNWTTTPNVASGSGDTFALTSAQFGANESVAVTGTVTDSETLDVFSDTITIYRLQDGENAYTGFLTNENHSIAADFDGTITGNLASAGGEMKVYYGVNELTTGVTYSIPSPNANMPMTLNASTGVYTPDDLTVDEATVTIRATHATYGVIDKVYTLNKARQGTEGVRGTKHYYTTTTGNQWDNTVADDYITSQGDVKQGWDIVTMSNESVGFSETRYWDTSDPLPANHQWTPVAQVIDGNLIVLGTIGAEKLSVSSLSSITANIGSISTAAIGSTGRRVEINNTSQPFAIYSESNVPLLSTSIPSGGTELELTINGKLTENTIDDALFFTEDGITNMRERLGLKQPLNATGGTENANIGTNFETGAGFYHTITAPFKTGSREVTISIRGNGTKQYDQPTNPNVTAPQYTVKHWWSESADGATNWSAWTALNPAGDVLTGIANVGYEAEFDRYQGVVYFNGTSTETIALGTTTPDYYVRIRTEVVHNSGTDIIPKVAAHSLSEPVIGDVLEAHSHVWGDIAAGGVNDYLKVDLIFDATANKKIKLPPNGKIESGDGNYIQFNDTSNTVEFYNGTTTAPLGALPNISVQPQDLLRVTSLHGFVDIGAQNASWCHFLTDRAQFYFNKGLQANGGIEVYPSTGNKITSTGVYDTNNRVYSALNNNIGTLSTQYAAGNHNHLNENLTLGNITVSSIDVVSSIKLKNIEYREDIQKSLEDVVSIGSKGVAVGRYKKDKDRVLHNFFIAEEVDAVDQKCSSNGKSVKTNDLLAKAYAAIAAHNEIIASQNEIIESYESRLKKLEEKYDNGLED